MNPNREYLTAISINEGIILLIDPSGEVKEYRQRGIQTLRKNEIAEAVKRGYLDGRWESIPELPKNYSISFEDTEIMGRALATFPLVLKKNALAKKANQ